MKHLVLDKNYKKGSKGKKVRLIQEWLCLHSFRICIDGDFGPATDYAVRQFQRREGLEVDGIVGRKTFAFSVPRWVQKLYKEEGLSENFNF